MVFGGHYEHACLAVVKTQSLASDKPRHTMLHERDLSCPLLKAPFTRGAVPSYIPLLLLCLRFSLRSGRIFFLLRRISATAGEGQIHVENPPYPVRSYPPVAFPFWRTKLTGNAQPYNRNEPIMLSLVRSLDYFMNAHNLIH